MDTVSFETVRFGQVEVEADKVIRFVAPILGFENLTDFAMLDHSPDSPFQWLQAVQDPSLAFVLTNPQYFGIEYQFALPESAVEKLGIKRAEDVIVFTIVNIPADNPTLMTANFLAPIVINHDTLAGMQVILQDERLSTRTRLLDEAGEVAQEAEPAEKGTP